MPPLFDHAGSLERMGGDEQLFCEMVGFFVTDAPQWLQQTRRGLESGDTNLAHRSAHTLKGLVANFGAAQAMAAAARVEELARNPATLPAAKEVFPSLESAIKDLEAALAAYHPRPNAASL